jgi:hypothetical protein
MSWMGLPKAGAGDPGASGRTPPRDPRPGAGKGSEQWTMPPRKTWLWFVIVLILNYFLVRLFMPGAEEPSRSPTADRPSKGGPDNGATSTAGAASRVALGNGHRQGLGDRQRHGRRRAGARTGAGGPGERATIRGIGPRATGGMPLTPWSARTAGAGSAWSPRCTIRR